MVPPLLLDLDHLPIILNCKSTQIARWFSEAVNKARVTASFCFVIEALLFILIYFVLKRLNAISSNLLGLLMSCMLSLLGLFMPRAEVSQTQFLYVWHLGFARSLTRNR